MATREINKLMRAHKRVDLSNIQTDLLRSASNLTRQNRVKT